MKETVGRVEDSAKIIADSADSRKSAARFGLARVASVAKDAEKREGTMQAVVIGALMGVGGTAAMDIWAWLLSRLAGQAFPNWAMPGRWLAHVFRGRMWHADIGASEAVPGELRLGWVLHYAVGVLYGVVFVVIAGTGWLAAPSFLPLWIFSIATIAAGWFLLQPGMGLGWAAARTANPWKVRLMGLIAHTVFALGMWAVAVSA